MAEGADIRCPSIGPDGLRCGLDRGHGLDHTALIDPTARWRRAGADTDNAHAIRTLRAMGMGRVRFDTTDAGGDAWAETLALLSTVTEHHIRALRRCLCPLLEHHTAQQRLSIKKANEAADILERLVLLNTLEAPARD